MEEQVELTLSYNTEDDVEILHIGGSLDAFTAETLESKIGELYQLEKNNIAVDFTNLVYISSAGLGVFMSYIEEIRESGGDIKLYGMNEKIYKIFDLLGFPMIFEITNTKEECLEKFKVKA